MKTDEAVRKLDAIPAGDTEVTHAEADAILLAVVPRAVREAYERHVKRCGRWFA